MTNQSRALDPRPPLLPHKPFSSLYPTVLPSSFPWSPPSGYPTISPTGYPSTLPSVLPTGFPTPTPTTTPYLDKNYARLQNQHSTSAGQSSGVLAAMITLALIGVLVCAAYFTYRRIYGLHKNQLPQLTIDGDEDALLARKSKLRPKPYYEKYVRNDYALESPVTVYKTAQYGSKSTKDAECSWVELTTAAQPHQHPRQHYDRRVVLV